jgi:hypothetical protein
MSRGYRTALYPEDYYVLGPGLSTKPPLPATHSTLYPVKRVPIRSRNVLAELLLRSVRLHMAPQTQNQCSRSDSLLTKRVYLRYSGELITILIFRGSTAGELLR